ncbi:hypothetical protein [Chryseobacterium indoltheticum]|uniref:hypothetical protein n=1 Tax=Chryseobacterium indoltheticum TaxID=254 RepID=UPI003F491777
MAGDTGVMADMELFPRLFGSLDLSILPIGGHYTMCARKRSFCSIRSIKNSKS